MPDVAELRRRIGRTVDDEELLLRATMPNEQVDAMLAAGPARRSYCATAATVKRLIRELSARTLLAQVCIKKPGAKLMLRAASRP
jgi:oxaloacetate decarboxylase alpha subunit